ncbi:MAG: DUF4331 domain-containing protein [Chloroflexi bacterium]|nr:DUF4331 domain-containing protein [Chloroflexota bacterium]
MFTKTRLAGGLALVMAFAILVIAIAPTPTRAASHREAPLISMDPEADITDFFMFRSYEDGQSNKVVLIMDVIPGEEPSSGPNYYNFDPNVLYSFYIDNDQDSKADDVRFEFQFKSTLRGINKDAGLFLSYVALPPITALDGAGSEGLGLRQTYNVTMVKGNKRHVIGENLFAVPSNVGPRTMPDYDALAAQGIYDLGDGVRVFAGQRDDPFYIDLGAIFDTLNLRAPGTDMLSGFNVHTIALQVPASMLTHDGKGPDATETPKLGAYAGTSRRKTTVLHSQREGSTHDGPWIQVQRLANPLVNEAIIGTKDKDKWNALAPHQEAQFLDYYENLRLDTALKLVFGADAAPLLNVRDLLLKYNPSDERLSELLRLDVSVPPVALGSQKRLTVLDGDNAGWPNGRRPIDDVTDIAIRVIGGTNYLSASDGVDANDKPLPDVFPFVSSPWDGRNRFHVSP